jgi:O-antigen/teichoic acid export membrane protein
VLVLYPHFQTRLGSTADARVVAREAVRATELQALFLSALAAGAFLVGPAVLERILPRYAEGVPALRPLLPGTLLLALAWPSRQFLIAVGRPWMLLAATLLGLFATLLAAYRGAVGGGLVGIASGMSLGFGAVFLLTSAAAVVPLLGFAAWVTHLRRLAGTLGWAAIAVACAVVTTTTLAPAVRGAAQLAVVGLALMPACSRAARALQDGSDVRAGSCLNRGSTRT